MGNSGQEVIIIEIKKLNCIYLRYFHIFNYLWLNKGLCLTFLKHYFNIHKVHFNYVRQFKQKKFLHGLCKDYFHERKLNGTVICYMRSGLLGSLGLWDQLFWRIKGQFGLCTVSQATCVSVNGIIWLMESIYLGPKVITLSKAHCTSKQKQTNAQKVVI